VIGQAKRVITKKHSELGRHLTTNYCESQYINLNGKFKVKKNAQVASALLFGTEKNLISKDILETFFMLYK
jgi:hypothetical protein